MPRTSTVITTYPLNIILSGGTSISTSLSYINVKNRTTGYYKNLKPTSDEAIVDLCKLSSDGTDNGTMANVNVGEIIDITVSGIRSGSSIHTIAASGGRRITITCVDASTTNAPAVNI
jgi:hypothetical protein